MLVSRHIVQAFQGHPDRFHAKLRSVGAGGFIPIPGIVWDKAPSKESRTHFAWLAESVADDEFGGVRRSTPIPPVVPTFKEFLSARQRSEAGRMHVSWQVTTRNSKFLEPVTKWKSPHGHPYVNRQKCLPGYQRLSSKLSPSQSGHLDEKERPRACESWPFRSWIPCGGIQHAEPHDDASGWVVSRFMHVLGRRTPSVASISTDLPS